MLSAALLAAASPGLAPGGEPETPPDCAEAERASGADRNADGPMAKRAPPESCRTESGLQSDAKRAAETAQEARRAGGFVEDHSIPDLSAGFDDLPPTESSAEEGPTDAPGSRGDDPFDLTGSLSLGLAYSYAQDSPARGQADYRGLSRVRAGMDLGLDVELPGGFEARVTGRGFRDLSYRLKERGAFDHEVLQTYESELELQEAYLQGSLASDVDIKVGRQVLAWGTSETLRVLDVLSPLDRREPGLGDLSDLRLPVAATRLSYFTGAYRLTGIAIHESRFDETPAFGSDFFPFAFRPPGEIRPANGGRDTEYGLALVGRFDRFDASLNAALYHDDTPHLGRDSGLLEHSRLQLFGASADIPLGSWLLRFEAARIRGLEFFGAEGKLARSDLLLGIEYAGFANTSVTLELVGRRLHGYQNTIEAFPDGARRNSFEGSLRYTSSFLNDRAELTVLMIVLGERAQDGTTLRASLDYDLLDQLVLSAGVLVFEEGERPPFSAYDANDRVFVNLRYLF